MALSLNRIPDRLITVQGRSYLYFGGTAYLGLQAHPLFLELFHRSVETYGMHYGSSRKSNISLEVYARAEQRLAQWVGSEDALCMSSGYLAAQLAVQSLMDKGHSLFLVPGGHPALLTKGVKTPLDFSELEAAVGREIEKGGPLPVVLFDTIAFWGGFFPDFGGLRTLPLDKMILIGDDSHGIGVVGRDGRGSYGLLKELNPAGLVVCCSLGKGLGVQAGALFGDARTLEMLRQTGFYGGASPPTPAVMGCLLEGGEIFSQRREKLMENYASFREGLKSISQFNHLEGHPTFEFGNASLAKALEDKGYIITHFHYPDADGPLLGRIVISAYHSREDVVQLAHCLDGLLA